MGDSMAAGVTVAAYASTDEATAVATTTTAADGTYTLTLPADAPLDGFLKATKEGDSITYLYPPAPLTADFDQASINMISTGDYNLLANLLGGGNAQKGTIVLLVVDSPSAVSTVADAMVTSSPAAARTGYSQAGSALPDLNATKTIADGRAFLFGLTPGMFTVRATKTGTTFKPTTLKVHANAFTTTLISP